MAVAPSFLASSQPSDPMSNPPILFPATSEFPLCFEQVSRGLLPPPGTVTRLVQCLGAAAALDLLLTGRAVSVAEATALEVGPYEASLPTAQTELDDLLATASLRARKLFRGALAPQMAIEAVHAALMLPTTEAMERESALTAQLAATPEAAARRYLRAAEAQAWVLADVPADTPRASLERVGIVGAGTMGGGIAMNFVNVGLPVTIVEMRQEALDRGLAAVRLNYKNAAQRGRISAQDVAERMALIRGSLTLEDLADADLVIEAVFEDMDIKKQIFSQIDRIAKPGAILATNTSALDIDEIARSVSRPEAVIGLHFFSPANVMRLIEVVRAEKTSKSVLATSMDVAQRIRKVAAVVGVCRGFVGNRMLFPRQLEAHRLVVAGATPAQVDRVLTDFGFPMGPFTMSDLAGLDIGWNKGAPGSEYLPFALCEMGRFGQKNRKGFYDYDEQRRATSSVEVEAFIEDLSRQRGIERRALADEEILQRCLFPMINEAARILEEGKAQRPSDIDVIWAHGFGWPTYRGGPMFWADMIGLPVIVAALAARVAEGAAHLAPATLLLRLASEGRGFASLAGQN